MPSSPSYCSSVWPAEAAIERNDPPDQVRDESAKPDQEQLLVKLGIISSVGAHDEQMDEADEEDHRDGEERSSSAQRSQRVCAAFGRQPVFAVGYVQEHWPAPRHPH